MMPLSYDARQHPRARARIRVEYHYDEKNGAGWTSDISEGGLFIHTADTAPAGTRIYLRLHLPGSRAGEPLKLIGHVVRADTLPAMFDTLGAGTPQGLGIQFEVAYATTREALSDFMQGMLHVANAPVSEDPLPGDDAAHYHARFPALDGRRGPASNANPSGYPHPPSVERAFAFTAPNVPDEDSAGGGVASMLIKVVLAVAALGVIGYALMELAGKFG